MNRKSLHIGIWLIFSLLSGISGQNTDINTNNTIQYQLKERVFLNLDKDIYLAGEDLHFSILCYDDNYKLPVNLSKIVYIELFDQDNTPLVQQKIFLDGAIGGGSLLIPKTCKTNYYYVRAYTNYMKNYGEQYFYMDRIKIVNPFFEIEKGESGISNNEPVYLTVYPEGGSFLSGINNTFAVKTNPIIRDNKQYTVFLKDESDSLVQEIKINKYGYGIGNFIPQSGKTYHIEYWKESKKNITTFQEIQNQGVHMNVWYDEDCLNVKYFTMNYSFLPLKIHANKDGQDRVVKTEISEKEGVIKLSYKDLPSGIIKLNMLNSLNESLCERFVFIPYQHELSITLEKDKQSYKLRDTVDIDVKVIDSDDISSSIYFAMSVFYMIDSNSIKYDNSFEKYSLINDIKKELKNYDISIIDQLVEDKSLLDLFLLTKMEEIEDKKAMKDTDVISLSYIPEIEGDIVSGRVVHKNSNEAIEGTIVFQSFIDSIARLGVSSTDKDGRFVFIIQEELDNPNLVISIKDSAKVYNVLIDDEFYPGFLEFKKETYYPFDVILENLKQSKVNIQVNDIFPKGKNIEESDIEIFKNRDFYGRPSTLYLTKDYVKLPNMEEFIFELLKGVKMYRKKGEVKFKMYEKENGYTLDGEPLVLYDGVPIFSYDELLELKPEQLISVGLVEHMYLYDDIFFGGIIDIKSIRANHTDVDLAENNYYFEFVSAKRSTEVPVNYISKGENKRFPLFLNTLYWSPYRLTDETGFTKIQFITGDVPGFYIVLCNGVSAEGQSGFSREYIKVKAP
ncbi:MAG: hypothetical protein JXB49_00520 [Bacteroidales bacterium]|nr:hypothetical protein [Bacteroidales bacterium]